MRQIAIIFILLSTLLLGCEKPVFQEPKAPAAQKAVKETKKETQREKKLSQKSQTTGQPIKENTFHSFNVFSTKGSRQNHYIPSGFMPNGKCITFSDTWQENCQMGKTCIKVTYDVECSRKDQKWAGIYWLNPANNWGSRKGGYNLVGAKKLTFWARGEMGGEQIQEFTIGGISGDYPDSDTAVIGPVILSSKWRQYTIDLRGKDLTYISGGFAWTTSEEVNPENCTFYLDNIRYE